MWLFNRKKTLKPAKAKSFHDKRLKFPDRTGETVPTAMTDWHLQQTEKKVDKFDRDEEDDE